MSNKSKVQHELNSLLGRSVSRVRRCRNVKEAAVERFADTDREVRASGLKHIVTINKIQMRSYPAYMANIDKILTELPKMRKQIRALPSFGSNIITRHSVIKAKNRVDEFLGQTDDSLRKIQEQMGVLLRLVQTEDKIVRSNMTIDNYADVRGMIEAEIEETDKLITMMNDGMDNVFRTMHFMGRLNRKFKGFIARTKKGKGLNLADEAQGTIDTVEQYISAFYTFKSYIQLVGIGFMLFGPSNSLRAIGGFLAYGIFSIDYLFDWISSVPAQNRWIKKISAIVKKVEDEETRKHRETLEYSLELANNIVPEVPELKIKKRAKARVETTAA